MAGAGGGMAVLPQYQGDYYALQRQQALAQALMQQALTPQQVQPTGSGPYTVMPKYSMGAGIAQLGQALLAAKLNSNVSQGYQNLGANQWAAFGGGGADGAGGAQQDQNRQALAQGAAAGSVGPTNDNAALASRLAPGGQQPGASAAPAQGSATPMNPLGLPPALAYMGYSSDPGKYFETQASAFKPADIVAQIRAAGIDPSSALGRQLAQQSLAKANYQAPTSIRGQVYADMNGVHTLPAPAPEGFQNFQDTEGNWHTVPVQGGPQAVQANAAAAAGGKAQYNIMPGFRNGQPVFTTAADIANSANGAQGGAGAPGSVNTGRFGGYQAPGSAPVAPSLAPGVAGAADKVAGANADRYNQAIQFGVDSATRQNVLDNIMQLSQSGVQTGPGSDWQNNVKGLIANSPVLSKAFPSWQGSVSDYQELKKYLNQNGLRAWQAAGGTGTDTQMDAAMHANPNDTMFPQALQTMAAWAKAGELAGSARANFYQQFKNNNGGVSNLDQADQTWRNNFDPKVFQLETYSPQQRTALLNSLTPTQAKQLMQKRAWFKQNGLLQ